MALAPGTSPYDIQRNRVRQDSTAAGVEQNDALKRRFARMGGLNSGSYAKASERLAGQQEQDQQKALEGIDVQESVAGEQKAEAERGRQFATSERLGSQDFAGNQSALGRAFATSERLGGQDFATSERLGSQGYASGESALQRRYATSEREAGQGFATAERLGAQGFQAGQNDLTRATQESQFGRSLAETQAARGQQGNQWQQTFDQSKSQYADQKDLANKQYIMDADATDFNQKLAAHTAGIDFSGLKAQIYDPDWYAHRAAQQQALASAQTNYAIPKPAFVRRTDR